jgi:hypothetical protein
LAIPVPSQRIQQSLFADDIEIRKILMALQLFETVRRSALRHVSCPSWSHVKARLALICNLVRLPQYEFGYQISVVVHA